MSWLRNVLFITLVTVGTAVLAISLRPRHVRTAAPGLLRPSLHVRERRQHRPRRRLAQPIKPAGLADELTVIRQLSLADRHGAGELRQFEKQPQDYRVGGLPIAQDRRSSDYLAERFARAFIRRRPVIFRRRRFVLWLSDQLHNRPYNEPSRR
jgi:hypothetical protein